MFMDPSRLLHTSKCWRNLWLPPQELVESMRFFFTTQFIQMELTNFYYIYYIVPKARTQFYFSNTCMQMQIITAMESSTGLSRSVIYNSLDSIASMQSALCPQNLTPNVSIKNGDLNQASLYWRANYIIIVSACTLVSALPSLQNNFSSHLP